MITFADASLQEQSSVRKNTLPQATEPTLFFSILEAIEHHPNLRQGDRELVSRWRDRGVPGRERLLFEAVCDRYRHPAPHCRRHSLRPVGLIGTQEALRCVCCGFIPASECRKVESHLRKLEAERREVRR